MSCFSTQMFTVFRAECAGGIKTWQFHFVCRAKNLGALTGMTEIFTTKDKNTNKTLKQTDNRQQTTDNRRQRTCSKKYHKDVIKTATT